MTDTLLTEILELTDLLKSACLFFLSISSLCQQTATLGSTQA